MRQREAAHPTKPPPVMNRGGVISEPMTPRPDPPKGAAPVREADVTKQVIDFLKVRGWRPVRMHSGLFRGRQASRVRVGEVGMSDWLVARYRDVITEQEIRFAEGYGLTWEPPRPPDLFWLELKADEKKKLRPGQSEWIAAEREKGALVCVAHSLESFTAWYEEIYG